MENPNEPVVGNEYWIPVFSSFGLGTCNVEVRVVHVKLIHIEDPVAYSGKDGVTFSRPSPPICVCVAVNLDGRVTANSYDVPATRLFHSAKEAWDSVRTSFEDAFKKLDEYMEQHDDRFAMEPYVGIMI